MEITLNNSRTFYNDKHHINSVITGVFLIVISFMAFGGNLLVLVAICINRNLRSVSDLFLANLAVADLCQAVVAMPLRIAVFLATGETNPIPCHIVIMFTILFGGASNINILFVSLDRFTAIKWPFKYNMSVTKNLFMATAAVSWFSLLLFTILPLLGWGRVEHALFSSTCRFTMTLERDYVITCYILIHGIPLGIIIVLYLFILQATFRHSQAIAAQEFSLRSNNVPTNDRSIPNEEMSTNGEQHQQRVRGYSSPRMRVRGSNRHRKGVRMIAVLLSVFIILVLPIVLIDLVEFWGGPLSHPAIVSIAICFIYANSGVNVFIYAGWNSEYRRTFRLVGVFLWKFVRRPCSKVRDLV